MTVGKSGESSIRALTKTNRPKEGKRDATEIYAAKEGERNQVRNNVTRGARQGEPGSVAGIQERFGAKRRGGSRGFSLERRPCTLHQSSLCARGLTTLRDKRSD